MNDRGLPELAAEADGYWCIICGRFLRADAYGVIVHDNVPHPKNMSFDEEEERPQ